MTTAQQLDLVLINGYLDALDIDVIRQMLDLYIQQSHQYLSDINSAIVQTDQKAWQEQCHKMKGSAASTGLIQVYESLVALEKSTQNWLVKADALKALSLLNQQAIDAFQQWLRSQ